MKKLFSLSILIIATGFCINLNAQSYCESKAVGSSQWEYIKNVTYAGILNDTPYESGGYCDYTSQVAFVYRNRTNDIYISVKADGNDYLYVFIDWNQDGIWNNDDPEALEVYTVKSKINKRDNGPHKLSILVPEGASLGSTTMRIILAYEMDIPLACGEFLHGEVEDYTVFVRGTNI